MAQEVLFTKTQDGRIAPADGLSAEQIDGLSVGQVYGATIKKKRNVKHLRKYWALMSAVFPHQAFYPTVKKLERGVKRALGLTEEVLNPVTMEYETDTGSIAFDKMEQDEFSEYYDRSVDLILTRIVPGVGREDLERQVLEILEGKQ